MRILLIEDDDMIGRALCGSLGREGLSVDWVRDGHDGAEALATGGHGLALLDLGLPGQSGLDILKAARRVGNRVPLIVITARDGVDDRIAGLEFGADDYLVKPFEMRELLARMRAVIRRSAGVALSVFEAGSLSLDLESHALICHDTIEILPAREFALMQALMERPGAILSRTQLEDRLYGWGEEVESNAVDVLIYSIRKKFGKDVIRNVRGAGWMVLKDCS
ncbi:MAG: response regulator transcription factor [Magnetospirillum sp.]|nr:MAG: response regulator transcription factor [Magnetospirillum sp.]